MTTVRQPGEAGSRGRSCSVPAAPSRRTKAAARQQAAVEAGERVYALRHQLRGHSEGGEELP
ncbi:hypothetical protein O1M54_03030 [Streptomyces diastatochromogenes]|nr:hypothetical protein [Streptomyces diastatochromogenes]